MLNKSFTKIPVEKQLQEYLSGNISQSQLSEAVYIFAAGQLARYFTSLKMHPSVQATYIQRFMRSTDYTSSKKILVECFASTAAQVEDNNVFDKIMALVFSLSSCQDYRKTTFAFGFFSDNSIKKLY